MDISLFEFYILDVNGTFSFVHVVFFSRITLMYLGNLGNSKRLSLALCFLLPVAVDASPQGCTRWRMGRVKVVVPFDVIITRMTLEGESRGGKGR